jgi:GNAT superfamily N-acetyltransferase
MPQKNRKAHARRYAEGDIPRLVEIVCREVPKLQNYEGVVVDASRVKFMLDNNINNDGYFMVFVLVNEYEEVVGGIGAYCVTMAFSWDRVCNDIFFFIMPEWRTLPNAVALMTAYRDWALARKATIIGATYTGGGNEESMDKLIRLVGFEPIGKLYHYRVKLHPREGGEHNRSTRNVSTKHAPRQQPAS